jgi:prenyltransferase beta subunit
MPWVCLILAIQTGQDAQIKDALRRIQAGDTKSRIAAAKSLARYSDANVQNEIRQELSKLAAADPKIDPMDVLSIFVQAHWTSSYAQSLGNYLGYADAAIAETAAHAICALPAYEPGEYFYTGLPGALRNVAIDLSIREALLRIASRGPLALLIPLLATPERTLRAKVVDLVDKAKGDVVLARALIALAKTPAVKNLDDGQRAPRPLLERIEGWLAKWLGEKEDLKEYEAHSERAYRSSLDKLADEAIQRGCKALLKAQQPDGCWTYPYQGYELGATALAIYTLLKCDVPPTDAQVAKGLEALMTREPANNYTVSLMAMALATAIEKLEASKKTKAAASKFKPRLQKMVDIAVASQQQDGGWSYTIRAETGTGVQRQPPPAAGGEPFDFSNTQFAVLALRAAANSGANVPRSTWQRALALYEKLRIPKDGGWPYHGRTASNQTQPMSSGTMTAASLYGWLICQSSLNPRLTLDKLREMEEYKGGIGYFESRWGVTRHGNTFYFLYSLERLCMAAKVERIGGHDWYAEGAEWLLARQAADGTWIGSYSTEVDTCLALLFLKRAFVSTPTIETEGAK